MIKHSEKRAQWFLFLFCVISMAFVLYCWSLCLEQAKLEPMQTPIKKGYEQVYGSQ